MSNKAGGVVTADGEQAQGLVPKLRFPAFRDAGAWEEKPLGFVASYSPDKISASNVAKGHYLSTESILADFGGVKTSSYPPSSGKVTGFSAGDILVSNIRPYLKKIWQASFSGGASNDVLVIRSNSKIDNGYLSTLLKNDRFVDYVSATAKGVKMPRGDTTSMMEYGIPIPPQRQEQQKIADCLSSLDAVIAAEGDRLAALKDHKKGLMQQLFPAPGQTTPPRRFPEFQGKGKWRWVSINEIATIKKGKGISKADIVTDGQQPCVRYGELYTTYGEVIDEVVSKTNISTAELLLSKANDVIIPASGETKLDIATASCVMHDDIALGGDLNVIRSNQNGVFLSYFLNGPLKYEIAKVAQGDSVVHLYPAQIGLLKVALPEKAEQQKIADCLRSIDVDLTNANRKLEVLKTHKAALMQQLFPSPHEAPEVIDA